MPSRDDDDGASGLASRLRFERFLAEVATRFLNLPAEALPAAFQRTLEGLLDALEVDRAGLGLFDATTDGLPISHAATRPGIPAQPLVDLAEVLPWYARQVRSGRTLVLDRLPDALPPEAEAERDYVTRIGMKSQLTVPMRVGNEFHGVLALARFREEPGWDPQLVPRLELLAGVLASGLHRRRIEIRLKAAEELNRSVLASMPQSVLVLGVDEQILAQNEAWPRALGGSHPAPGSSRTFRDWARANGCDEVEHGEAVRAVLAGLRPRHEAPCRHVDGGDTRTYTVTVTPLDGDPAGAVVVHTDVTELAQAKAALQRTLQEIQELHDRLEAENVVLQEQVRQTHDFGEIVGTSAALGRVLTQVGQVAPTDAPVLLQGETGTGKDLVARAVHARSRRAGRPLVTVNCAALPATLVESELFGYEKGAFTGALQRTFGRFETAHGGSLFLDEIGELPLEVQAKLLRVLQTGEFERLGSSKTTRVDVRLIAATNRDLEKEVREGRFRPDLFYRLSVFPVALPALRDRREDIPLLVWHFIGRRQAALGRLIKRVPERLMRAFTAYSWPGNVRELENVVERALILSDGPTLAVDPGFLAAAPATAAVGPRASLADAERAHIRAVLEECGWKLAGRGNAADRLGLKRSTLQFRMKKLGIARPERGGRAKALQD